MYLLKQHFSALAHFTAFDCSAVDIVSFCIRAINSHIIIYLCCVLPRMFLSTIVHFVQFHPLLSMGKPDNQIMGGQWYQWRSWMSSLIFATLLCILILILILFLIFKGLHLVKMGQNNNVLPKTWWPFKYCQRHNLCCSTTVQHSWGISVMGIKLSHLYISQIYIYPNFSNLYISPICSAFQH